LDGIGATFCGGMMLSGMASSTLIHRGRSLYRSLELGRWRALVLLEMEGFEGVDGH
jgi:uncharacterized protein involved in response to NO